jgi:hypothetical protein
MCRTFVVFSKAALDASAAAAGGDADEPPEGFYDVTAHDLHRELAAQQRRHAHSDAGLRTRKLCAPPWVDALLCCVVSMFSCRWRGTKGVDVA